jgi:hypothetical protein
MQRNFDYIERKDSLIERQMMNLEDKPTYYVDFDQFFERLLCFQIVLFKKAQEIMITMSKGKYKVNDQNGFIGLGSRNNGIKVPIEVKSQHPSSKNGIGFVYSRNKYYPNRKRENINWINSSMV